MGERKDRTCSFCGRKERDVELLLTGFGANICNDCIDSASEIVKENLGSKSKFSKSDFLEKELPKPIDIKNHLDKYVIGQDTAKMLLSVAVYNHYKRIRYEKTRAADSVEIDKSNVILVGPTGTGKTLLARTIARMLNVPFCIVDATVLTEAGYVGEDVENILVRLLQAADYDVPAAEKGIVFIDEIDKIARKQDNPSITRDVSGEGVQQAMLKLLEGAVVNVPPQGGRKHPEQKMIEINTKDILFISGGAFDGIDKIIASRLKTNVLGFGASKKNQVIDVDNIYQYVSSVDIRKYGLIPELVGRFPVVTYLEVLDKESLIKILVEPENAIIKQFIKLFELDNVKLEFTDEAIEHIVDKAIEFKIGARGLRAIIEMLLAKDMFELPSNSKVKKLTVDKKYVTKRFAEINIEQLSMSNVK